MCSRRLSLLISLLLGCAQPQGASPPGGGDVLPAVHGPDASVLTSCGAPGPRWQDEQTVSVDSESAPGRTGQWWCDHHFGGNLGGAWECIEEAGGPCAEQVPAGGHARCGRLGADGATPYCGAQDAVPPFGYGRVERVLVSGSAPGQTGQWWCDQHFGGHLGGAWKCRGVSGAHDCSTTVPNDELVSCGQYGDVQSVAAYAPAPGRTGQWWCDQHFGKNLGGSWDCLRVDGGRCDADAPAGAPVTCGRYQPVDEAPFAPPACDDASLDGAEREFCRGTEYMRTRQSASYYLFNDHVRAGLDRSFGGALFELYGSDRRNRIEEHGGSAAQLSIWGYDGTPGHAASWFTTRVCDATPYADESTCRGRNDGAACRLFGSGAHVSDCVHSRPCGDWSAGAPWNPIQAQAEGCGWDGPSNDVSGVSAAGGTLSLVKAGPYHFTKTTAMTGMTWRVTGNLPSDRPYVKLTYRMTYRGPVVGAHNQEIPALFTDARVSSWYYYYGGDRPYADAGGAVTRKRADFGTEDPGCRAAATLCPSPRPASYSDAAEAWMTVCDHSETECLTIATFAPQVKVLVQSGQYVTPLGRFALGGDFDESWEIYLFPYRYDQVVAGKSVREWIYELPR